MATYRNPEFTDELLEMLVRFLERVNGEKVSFHTSLARYRNNPEKGFAANVDVQHPTENALARWFGRNRSHGEKPTVEQLRLELEPLRHLVHDLIGVQLDYRVSKEDFALVFPRAVLSELLAIDLETFVQVWRRALLSHGVNWKDAFVAPSKAEDAEREEPTVPHHLLVAARESYDKVREGRTSKPVKLSYGAAEHMLELVVLSLLEATGY